MDTDSDRRTIKGQLSATHPRLLLVFFMHDTGSVPQSEAMGNGIGRITAEERSDSGMP